MINILFYNFYYIDNEILISNKNSLEFDCWIN